MGGETEEIQEAGVKHGKIQGFGGKKGKFQNLVFDNRLSNIKSPEIFTRHIVGLIFPGWGKNLKIQDEEGK